MRITNNLFKVILPLLLMLTAFSVDAQFTRTTVFMGGGTGTGGTPEPYSYTFDISIELLQEESPCEMYVGVTLEESTSQITYFAQAPDTGSGDITINFPDLDNVIFDELCLSGGIDMLHFVFNLYCHDGNGNYTVIDPCEVEMVPYFRQDGSCDLSVTVVEDSPCPVTYTSGAGAETEVSQSISQQDAVNSSIRLKKTFDNTQLRVNYSFNSDFIELKNNTNNNINYQIITVSGQIIHQGNLTEKDLERQIDVSNLIHGLYIITYGNKNFIESKKFVR